MKAWNTSLVLSFEKSNTKYSGGNGNYANACRNIDYFTAGMRKMLLRTIL